MMGYINFKSKYDKFPVIPVNHNENQLMNGFESIIQELKKIKKGILVFETYPGVSLSVLRQEIIDKLSPDEIIFSEDYTVSEEDYDHLLERHLFDDRVFGLYSHHQIDDFYQIDLIHEKQSKINPDKLTIIYGFGASLFQYDKLVFVSLTRWNIQLRYREGLSNFKKHNPEEDILRKYKRGYFIEWRVADRIKEKHYDHLDYVLDFNQDDNPKMINKVTYEDCLDQTVSRPFRLVPYFDPGVWGGQWMKEVCNLDPSQPNYAWSFDGVPEENSLRFGFNDDFIEIPAQDVVLFRPNQFMGERVHARFGKHFPIRFDFLDTFEGGNLSLQVHPQTKYIQETFGMTYTQDESYYILDAKEDAVVYLGLKKDIDQDQFKQDLIDANKGLKPFDDQKYINQIPVKKHDHLLIPGGTIHCSGKDTMVLEISSCVYIFTFKLWDWGRLGLDGLPRPVHLNHGFQNIDFSRDTEFVHRELVNQFQPVSKEEEITGLHELEFIESRRYHIEKELIMETLDQVNVCNLVEGQELRIESLNNEFEPYHIHYAETFYIPATISKVKFISLDPNGCKVIKAMVK